MEWFDIYRDFLTNLFMFLSLHLFINIFGTCIVRDKQRIFRGIFVIIWLIFSLFPSIPYFMYITFCTEILYTLISTKGRVILRLCLYIKYLIYHHIGSLFFAALHTLITFDLTIFESNKLYADYVGIINSFLLYLVLCVYLITKKFSHFPTGKVYKRYFLATTGIISLVLIVCSMLLGSTFLDENGIIMIIFSLLLIITLLCISVYRKVVTVLEENMQNRIEHEKNTLLQDYSVHVEENLKKLSLLRHDFRNHMIILQGYAVTDRKEELMAYIGSLTDELSSVSLIHTPSSVISSLINAKREECIRKDITLNFEWDFSAIHIDDFHLITIISNALDNAITAAVKCSKGIITLKIFEHDSYLEITCINNHQECLKVENHILKTTKTEQPQIHGLGLLSIQKAVNELHGELKIDYTDNIFQLLSLLPNYK